MHGSFDKTLIVSAPDNLDILAVALSEFAMIDERKARVVEMRFFGGLMETEIAEALGVSVQTVRRDWSLTRSWLLRRLTTEVDE